MGGWLAEHCCAWRCTCRRRQGRCRGGGRGAGTCSCLACAAKQGAWQAVTLPPEKAPAGPFCPGPAQGPACPCSCASAPLPTPTYTRTHTPRSLCSTAWPAPHYGMRAGATGNCRRRHDWGGASPHGLLERAVRCCPDLAPPPPTPRLACCCCCSAAREWRGGEGGEGRRAWVGGIVVAAVADGHCIC